MNQLNESSTEMYQRLMEELSPKAKVSLERVKVACDTIETSRGTMNYTRVADLATERFGGPRRQSVQNNKTLKFYIAKRIEELDNHSPTKKTINAKNEEYAGYLSDVNYFGRMATINLAGFESLI